MSSARERDTVRGEGPAAASPPGDAVEAGADVPPATRGAQIARAVAATAIGSGLFHLAGLLTFLLLSHRLSPAELGAYRQIAILRSIAALVWAMGVPDAMLYALGRAAAGERPLVFAGAARWLLVATPALALTSGGGTWLAGRLLDRPALAAAAPLAAVVGGLEIAFLFAGPLWASIGRARGYMLAAAGHLVALLLLTALLTTRTPTLTSALAAAAIPAASLYLLTLLLFWRHSAGACAADLWRTQVAPALRYGAPAALGATLYLVGYQLDHLVASGHFSAAQYGIYAAGAWQLPVLGFLQQGHRTVLVPVMAAHHVGKRPEAFWREWRHQVEPAVWLAAALFWPLMLGAADLVAVALGPPYAPSVAVFRTYAFFLPLQTVAFNLPLRAVGSTGWEAIAGLVQIAVTLSAAVGLVPMFGLIGPAVALLLGMTARAALLVGVTCRRIGVAPGQMLPVRAAVAGYLVTGGAAALAWLVTDRLALAAGAGRLLGAVAIYAALLLLLCHLRRR